MSIKWALLSSINEYECPWHHIHLRNIFELIKAGWNAHLGLVTDRCRLVVQTLRRFENHRVFKQAQRSLFWFIGIALCERRKHVTHCNGAKKEGKQCSKRLFYFLIIFSKSMRVTIKNYDEGQIYNKIISTDEISNEISFRMSRNVLSCSQYRFVLFL